jgi:predicted nucleotidyltransferase
MALVLAESALQDILVLCRRGRQRPRGQLGFSSPAPREFARCSTIQARCGTMGIVMATRVQAPDAALLERERVVRALREHEADLRALGVTRLWLFGSVARGDARPDSDVDVLIDISPGRKFSLLDLAEVRLALCDLLGREAGVVIRQDLRPRFRDTIADDLIEIF